MLTEYTLNVGAELEYARKWAYGRNPAYYNFDALGGDCTNFISQCLYAGGAVMNYTPVTGWYYESLGDRAAAWTGVEFLHKFLINNTGAGPYGYEVSKRNARTGDIIQLGTVSGGFYHSLLIIGFDFGVPLIAAHTNNAYNVPITAYGYERIRFIHIGGARKYVW